MSKVELDTLKPWITQKITDVLGFEDDVVIEFIFNQLEERVGSSGRHAVLSPLCYVSLFVRLSGTLFDAGDKARVGLPINIKSSASTAYACQTFRWFCAISISNNC